MLSLEQCRKILNSKGYKYNIEEIKQIRDFLYKIANLEIELNNKQISKL